MKVHTSAAIRITHVYQLLCVGYLHKIEPRVALTVSWLKHKNTFDIHLTLDTSHPLRQRRKNRDPKITAGRFKTKI